MSKLQVTDARLSRSQLVNIRKITLIGLSAVCIGSLILAGLLFGIGKTAAIAQNKSAAKLLEYWQTYPVLIGSGIGHVLSDTVDSAVLTIPKLGENWAKIIAEGVGPEVLDDPASGVGHYPNSAGIGRLGNFALAAHRTGNGDPFLNLDQLTVADEIIITTATNSYRYLVTGSKIVAATDLSVLADSPGKATITLTTCHPKYSWAQRLVIHGELAPNKER